MVSFRSIRGLRISLAGPEQIRAWSSGEVTKAGTINYQTLKPERDGLFCERIFGPIKNWTCSCGKYHSVRDKGKTCDRCGVKIAPARVRRLRMGHIELAAPICHPWYAQGMPSHIALLLDLTQRELDHILSFTRYIVLHIDEAARQEALQCIRDEIARVETIQDGQNSPQDAGSSCDESRVQHLRQILYDLSQLTRLTVLEIGRYRALRAEYGQVFRAGTGAETIQQLLAELDLDALARSLRRKIHDAKRNMRSRAIKRLRVVEALWRSHTDPRRLVLTVLPVLPPDLRPVVPVSAGRFASADVNALYARVIHRNNRLKRFLAYGAPELMIYHEKQMLQAACDSLLDNLHCRHPLLNSQRRPLRSLTDSLSGKKGLFRHNLLGKRVDYSGRSVICVGLELKLHQCGLPKKIALELFKPFIIHKLLAYNIVQTLKQAERALERRHAAVWDILAEVMRGRCVLLNRAPTLHRLSIQAFEPVLVEGDAIRLPPQVCSAFNADFDGDQMAVHLPLSAEAQAEAHELMLSTRNLLSPASGEPAISISQDMVLGCFYLTQEQPARKGEGQVFADANEATLAYRQGVVDLQASIIVRIEQETIFEQPPPASPIAHLKGGRLRTTVGRLLFNEVLPKRLRFKNYAMKKEHLKQIIIDCIKIYGVERTVILADDLKRLGFAYATRAGISLAAVDFVVPVGKKEVLAQADEKIRQFDSDWRMGLISGDERHQKAIEAWNEATRCIEQMLQESLDPFAPLATIANSGATKARLQQLRQLSGMRGLMTDSTGGIIETPVRSNFLEGLSAAEYFISSHGARKSMMDKSLNTAEAGYLTIRLENAAQDIVVVEEDCGTSEGLPITEADSVCMGLADSRTRLIGRVLAEPLPQVGMEAGDELNEAAVERLLAVHIPIVCVRSVLTCQSRRGVCCKCYGWDLSRHALVQKGMAVGIIAAQSIGEPGTQLTMRIFHSGGVAGNQDDITHGLARVEELFEARAPREPAIVSEVDGIVEVSRDEQSGKYVVRLLTSNSEDTTVMRSESTHAWSCVVPARRKLVVSTGQRIHAGEPITSGVLHLQELLRLQGREALERYLLREAQLVYRRAGAYIHDKHFEVIIRQMLRRVQVEEPGDTDLLPGDVVDRFAFVGLNAQVVAQGGEPAIARVILLGLTRAALATESWLAAASFQQTGRVLAQAALEGSTDYLVGLKENIIAGRLIPAGTGFSPRRTSEERQMRSARARRGRPKRKY